MFNGAVVVVASILFPSAVFIVASAAVCSNAPLLFFVCGNSCSNCNAAAETADADAVVHDDDTDETETDDSDNSADDKT